MSSPHREVAASARAVWSEVDLEGGLITLPGERTKNGYPHEIAITKPIRTILEAQRRDSNDNGRELVFGRGAGGFQDFSGSKVELDQRVAAAREARGLGPMPAWVPHDFRRSVSTTMPRARTCGSAIASSNSSTGPAGMPTASSASSQWADGFSLKRRSSRATSASLLRTRSPLLAKRRSCVSVRS